MRILLLVPRPGIRGPIPGITSLLEAGLREAGCALDTEYWGRRRDGESALDRVAGRSGDIARIRRRLGEEPPDVMVVTTAHDWPSLSRDIPLLLATRRRVGRIVVQFHGSHAESLAAPGSRLLKAASATVVRLSDALLLLSTEEQRDWQRFRPAGDYRVVSNPYRPAGDGPAAHDRPALGLPTDRPLLLFVGRLVAEKGILDLVEALPRVLQRQPCHLLVLGHGAEEHEVARRVAALGLEREVTLAGYLAGEQLRSAYRLADALVLPSYHDEGFPTVIAEAMDAGLAIVTTRRRGMADHLREGEQALFVPPRDPAALAEAVVHLLARPGLRARMGAANRAAVRAFLPEVVAREYLRILEEIVGRA